MWHIAVVLLLLLSHVTKKWTKTKILLSKNFNQYLLYTKENYLQLKVLLLSNLNDILSLRGTPFFVRMENFFWENSMCVCVFIFQLKRSNLNLINKFIFQFWNRHSVRRKKFIRLKVLNNHLKPIIYISSLSSVHFPTLLHSSHTICIRSIVNVLNFYWWHIELFD